jgi:hypothetical protein
MTTCPVEEHLRRRDGKAEDVCRLFDWQPEGLYETEALWGIVR